MPAIPARAASVHARHPPPPPPAAHSSHAAQPPAIIPAAEEDGYTNVFDVNNVRAVAENDDFFIFALSSLLFAQLQQRLQSLRRRRRRSPSRSKAVSRHSTTPSAIRFVVGVGGGDSHSV